MIRGSRGTCQTLLLMLGLLLPVEGVKSPRWAVGEQRRKLLGLELLLDAVELTATGGHCGRERLRHGFCPLGTFSHLRTQTH